MDTNDYFKDLLGKQLNVGDTVIFSETEVHLKQGIVSRMTPQKVCIVQKGESYVVHRYPKEVMKKGTTKNNMLYVFMMLVMTRFSTQKGIINLTSPDGMAKK